MKFISDILNLFYPNICAGCNTPLVDGEKHICTQCLVSLPKTYYWNDKNNPSAQIFWGRLYTENVASFLFFRKKSRLQNIIHAVKYHNNKELGIYLGFLFGNELRCTEFNTAEVIIPVPLHKSKLIKRGYNQSELIAQGLSKSLNIPIADNVLVRTHITDTQTHKGRYDRWLNIKDKFIVQDSSKIEGKHVLLVDDVLTTGATLEACGIELLKVNGVTLSIATLAKTVHD